MNTQEDDSLLYRSGQNRGRLLWFVGIGLFIAWNLLLFILAVVAIAKVNNQSSSSGSSYTYAPISRPFKVGMNQQIGAGRVVSLLPDGTLRAGAGTTIFPQRGPLPQIPITSTNLLGITFNPPLAAELTPLAKSELALVAYTVDGHVVASLGILSVSGTSLTTWGTPQVVTGLKTCEALIPLNILDASGSSMKSFVIAGGGMLVVGSITNETAGSLAFTTSTAQPYNGTDTTVLARLSSNQFGLAYRTIVPLNPGSVHQLQASVGTVTYKPNGQFESFTVSAPLLYVTNRPYHTIFPLVDLTKQTTEFIIAYPLLPAMIVNSTDLAADALIAQKAIWNPADNTLRFGPPARLSGVAPGYMMTSVPMPTTGSNPQPKGVVFFIDENHDNALSAVTVFRDPGAPAPLDGLAFGEVRVISNNAADPSFQFKDSTLIPFISASAIDDVQIGLAFSNFADYGKIVTSTLAVSSNRLTVTATSTEFVISTLNPNLQSNYWWVETAPLHFGTQFGFAVWAYLQTGSNTTDKVIQAVVEIAPPPLGIVPFTYTGAGNTGDQVPVILSGVCTMTPSPPFTSTVGRFYYSDTLGTLHVRGGNQTSVDYVVGEDGSLLSLNSRTGVAISPSELLLLSQLS